MVLPIYKFDNKTELAVLKAQSVDVVEFTEEIRDFCANMVDTMLAVVTGAAGLAAPQVGKNLNIFVMRTERGMAEDTNEHIVPINPFTVIEVGEKISGREGCLSIPGYAGDVDRFPELGCVYWTPDGVRHAGHFKDFQARIYQHEFDHLEGVLYPDKATKFGKIRFK